MAPQATPLNPQDDKALPGCVVERLSPEDLAYAVGFLSALGQTNDPETPHGTATQEPADRAA